MTLEEWLAAARRRCPELLPLELRLLISQATGLSRAQQYGHGEALPPAALATLEANLRRLEGGEPLAYVLGHWEFFDFSLKVSPATLIPRPDTEVLVEAALERLPVDRAADVIDLGTGSGAIALALARHRPRARLLAIDNSAAALAVAEENARTLGLDNVRFLQNSWLDGLAGRAADLIVSNPPYIDPADEHLPALRHEPRSALVAGEQGFADLWAIVDTAPAVLRPGGWLLLEHGFEQGAAVHHRLESRGWERVETRRDRAGRERVSGGCWPG